MPGLSNLKVAIPYSKKLVTENAAMIGVTAWYQYQQHRIVENALSIDRQPNLNFPKVNNYEH